MAGISTAERQQIAEVKAKFESHEMDDIAAQAAEGLRKAFQKIAVDIHKQLPDGRNKSLALTHLEDASMRAIRALSHDGGVKGNEPVPAAVVETPAPADDEAPAPVRRGPRKRTAKTA